MLPRAFILALASLTRTSDAIPASAASGSTKISATTTLASPAEASRALSSLYEAKPNKTSLLTAYIENGLTTVDLAEAVEFVETPLSGPNGDKNVNKGVRNPPAYPKAAADDAPYSLPEEELQRALHIPPTFQCDCNSQPLILVPGTGATGYISFQGNYIPLLNHSAIANPIWLNIPGFMLDDIQTNAEYIAYAINYMYGICEQKLAVAAWSQGNIAAQWAVTDHIAFSPDYHGTTIFSSSSPDTSPVAPASLQQAYNSTFIQTLRSHDGDAAYVPTTVIFSGTYDEIVEPQQGANASAHLLSSKHAEASNNQVQLVCPGQPAGSFHTHEGILYNPVGYALLEDALSHEGLGRASRLDLKTVCAEYLSQGLSLEDMRLTHDAIVIGGIAGAYYPNKTTVEPRIKSYAQTRAAGWHDDAE